MLPFLVRLSVVRRVAVLLQSVIWWAIYCSWKRYGGGLYTVLVLLQAVIWMAI